ncbi:MAG TPA: hypothetical protein VH518_20655 [Tepidisphaeraceae bacterium]|jgi:hypothetical protein
MHRVTNFLLLGLIFCITSGCTTTVTPPPHVGDPVTVYLADYGRHSSLLLPTSPNHYMEYAFGDWNFFALGHTQWWVGAEAMVHSPKSTLGRREVVVKADDERLRRWLGCKRLMRFQADRLRVDVLNMNLERTFDVSPIESVHSKYSDLDHVPDDEQYWGFHNCNHVTAEWLRQLGCEVTGTANFSNFRLSATTPSPSTLGEGRGEGSSNYPP